MITTFLQTLPGILLEMKDATDAKAWEKLSRLAHQIKPSFTLMGLDCLRATILFIEENGKGRTRLEELPAVIEDFTKKCEIVIQELSKEVLSPTN
jgi:HPt (histidine-containing phosphotransfer) domain-containing protein